jgi:phage anti-repressor protein
MISRNTNNILIDTSTVFTNLLKTYTTIPHSFVDSFFTKFKLENDDNPEFYIKEEDVSKWLKIEVTTIRERLRNKYQNKLKKNTNNPMYVENVDYTVQTNTKDKRKLHYLLSYKCFEKICMLTETEEGSQVRLYFVKLRQFVSEHYQSISQALSTNLSIKDISKKIKEKGLSCIYIIGLSKEIDLRSETSTSGLKDLFKPGRTTNLVNRFSNYNSGRLNDVDIRYVAVVKNEIAIEHCMSVKLDKYRYVKDSEIYKVNIDVIKQIISECSCKYMNKKEYLDVLSGMEEIFSFYNFLKEESEVIPFIIINKS